MKLIKVAVTGGICSGKSTVAKYLGSQEGCCYLNLDDFTNTIYFRHPKKLVILIERIEKELSNGELILKKDLELKLFDVFKNFDKNSINFYKEFFNKKELGKVAFREKNLERKLESSDKESILEIIKFEIVPEIIKVESLTINKIIREEKIKNSNISRKNDLNNIKNKESNLYVFIEAPTVIESNRTNQYDEIWSCFASEDIIKKRFLERISNQKNCNYNLDTLTSIQKNQVSLEVRKAHSNVMLSTSDTTDNNLANAFSELKKLKSRFSLL